MSTWCDCTTYCKGWTPEAGACQGLPPPAALGRPVSDTPITDELMREKAMEALGRLAVRSDYAGLASSILGDYIGHVEAKRDALALRLSDAQRELEAAKMLCAKAQAGWQESMDILERAAEERGALVEELRAALIHALDADIHQQAECEECHKMFAALAAAKERA